MIFKCRNCGGNVIYSPEKRSMVCPYCESVDSHERVDAGSEDIRICPDCGGEIPLLQFTSATQCPYCNNYVILNSRVEGAYEPRMMIPFRMGKEKCKEIIRNKFKHCTFAPTDFLSEARLDAIQGTYVPFWFFNYRVDCDFLGEGTKTRTWTTGNTQYTETSYYEVRRNLTTRFENIPADASVNMPDDVMDLMEPYQYQELERFRPEVMSGFYSEYYNMEAEDVADRAKQKMQGDMGQLLRASYSGYGGMRTIRQDMDAKEGETTYGLLPVWRYQYLYKNQNYPFYVNGQTGKLVGTAPVSKAKVWAYTVSLWGILTAILALADGILKMVL